MLEWLRGVDHGLFLKINAVWAHPWLDSFLPLLTDLHKVRVLAWGAFPVALLWWVYEKRGRAVKAIVAVAVAVALSDIVSHRVLKPYFQRLRPQKAGLSVVLRTQPHHGLSFPSNHAANSFSAATTLAAFQPGLAIPAFFAAALVAYSRVYVGVHFPFDVVAGALFGFLVGRLVVWLFRGLGFLRR